MYNELFEECSDTDLIHKKEKQFTIHFISGKSIKVSVTVVNGIRNALLQRQTYYMLDDIILININNITYIK